MSGGGAAPAVWALAAALGLAAAGVSGQTGGPDMPALEGLRPLGEVPVLATPAVVRSASRIEAEPAGGPVPFAEPFAVEVTPAGRGVWEVTSDGRFAVWRLRVVSSGAVSLNFGFTRYRMPPGGRLRVYPAEGGESFGPFTDADNEAHGQLWTPVVSGGDAVIEVAVPAGREEELELELTSVNRGFRDLFPSVVRSPRHASCHVDVACPEADPYRDQVRSVAFFSMNGRDTCSGSLISNTARDRKPYFLTAAHCVGAASAPTVVVYWNHESPTCGARSGGSRAQNQSGAVLVASSRSEDFALLLLDDEVDPDHDLFFAGWNADPAPPSSAISIHHPRVHVKSISIATRPLTVTGHFPATTRGTGRYLRVSSWDLGASEGGSSGSPLFGPDKRIAGQLWGGRSTCHQGGGTWFGRLASSWFGGGVPESRLMDWLDPLGTGEMAIDGMPWNYAPETAGTLHGKSLRLAGGSLEVDVAHGFHDRDGDALVYTVSSSDETIATAAISGSTVTVSPVAAGTVTVTVTASDGKSDPVSRTFPVTVGANRSPEPVGTLAALSLRVADGASSVDVSAAFEDDDGDTLTYGASSSDESVATVSVSGSTVSVTPVSGGKAVISVTATDAAGSNTSARQGFEATVANRPPAAAGVLPDLSLVRKLGGKGAETVDPRAAFRDPDGDLLTFSASSSDDSVVSVSLFWGPLTVTPVKIGSATVTVSATDPAGSRTATSRTFAVTVANGPPEVLDSALSSFHAPLAGVRRSINLADVFGDPDGDDLVYEVTSPAPAVVAVALSGSTATFTVTPSAFGDTVVTATATDTAGSNTTVSHGITVRVANRGPVFTGTAFPRVWMREGEPDREVHLSRLFLDPDGEAMTFSCWTNFVAVATCAVVGDRLRFSPVGAGKAPIQVRARDIWNAEATGYIGVGVVAAPPVAVSFGSASHEVTEGGSVTVEVRLDGDPERDLEIVLERTHHGGASSADYSGVPSRVAFRAGVTTRRFLVSATDDGEDDDGEAVALGFASLPFRVSGGGETTIAILDNDDGGPPTGGPPTGGPGGPGGPPPPPDDEEDDEDDGDDGGPPPGGPPPGSGGGGPPRAAMETDAECEAGLCRARTGEPVSFEDASAGSVRSRHWDFGDGGRSRSASPSHAWSSPGFHEVALVVSDGSVESTASLIFLVEAAEPAGACAADAWTRCLGDSRYAVTVEWRGAAGETGRGKVAHAGTNESGMFRFFGDENWEILIKVLDGCEANGHAWVFGASTTDLGYVIRVSDTATGAVKEYRNEPGTAAPAITDVKAFPEGCGSV